LTEDVSLNIGAGHTYVPGFVNIDISDRAELTLDVGKDALPFADSSVESVLSIHTLEHIPDYLFALSEIHRVLRHDGALLLKLPYVTLTESNLINPYHRHNFSERSFDFFDPDRLKGSAAEESPILFRRVFVRYTYLGYFGALPSSLRTWARRHLFNVVRQFDIGLVAIKEPQPIDTSKERARELEARLDQLARARTPYAAGLAPSPSAQNRNPLMAKVSGRIRRHTQTRGR
jgi:SAM-dependent methyltransferase